MDYSKPLVILALTTISCVSVCVNAAPNQAKATSASTLSKDFLSFWERFKAALRKNDKNALADLTKLPYTAQDKKLDKAGFIAASETIFSASTRKCLQREKPVHDKDSVFVFCGESIYVFAKEQGKYKFIEINAND